jgi:hypothetical protein
MRSTLLFSIALLTLTGPASASTHLIRAHAQKAKGTAERIVLDIPIGREHGASTYCSDYLTGEHDIELTSSSGTHVATISKLCVNLSEQRTARDGRYVATHTVDSLWSAKIKDSKWKVSSSRFSLDLLQESGSAAIIEKLTPATDVWWNCVQNGHLTDAHPGNSSTDLYPPTGPDLIPIASDVATAHIEVWFIKGC